MGDGMLIRGADVWGAPDVDAVVVSAGRIAAIGRGEDLAGTGLELDARGSSLLPGFIDAHTHLVDSGLVECGFSVSLSGCERDEALERLAAAGRRRAPGEWVVASGWDESLWTPSRRLTRDDLDRATVDCPVLAIRIDGHLATLNARALREAESALHDVRQWVDASSGHVRETAVDRVRELARPDAMTIDEALRAAARRCHALGITTAHVMSGAVDPRRFLDAAAALRLRLVVHPPADRLATLVGEGEVTGGGDEWARWGGVKLFADGSIGAQNAAVSRYRDGGRGRLNLRRASLIACLESADRNGWQTLTHAIGDRAIGQVLAAHRAARTDGALRHRIEHFEFPTEEQVSETRTLGLCVCMQPNFVGNWGGLGGLYEAALGRRRAARGNPFRRVLDAGIPLGFGSDGMPLSPLYGVSSAVRAPHDAQRLTLGEAVHAYTVGSADLSGGAPSGGRIAEGDPADLVLLDGPLDATGIGVRRAARTWVGGALVYSQEEAG
ncbi:MAG: amidohydrolase [Candidatus Bipolaricaulota bacterium]